MILVHSSLLKFAPKPSSIYTYLHEDFMPPRSEGVKPNGRDYVKSENDTVTQGLIKYSITHSEDVFIIPLASESVWISDETRVDLGLAFLAQAKCVPSAKVHIFILGKVRDRIEIVPGLDLDMIDCSFDEFVLKAQALDLNAYGKRKASQEIVVAKRLKTEKKDLALPSVAMVVDEPALQASASTSKLQKPYLRWTIDEDVRLEKFPKNSLGAMIAKRKERIWGRQNNVQ